MVKEFNLSKAGDKVLRDAFREADVLRMLDHPGIIAYYDTFQDQGAPYP